MVITMADGGLRHGGHDHDDEDSAGKGEGRLGVQMNLFSSLLICVVIMDY